MPANDLPSPDWPAAQSSPTRPSLRAALQHLQAQKEPHGRTLVDKLLDAAMERNS